MEDCSMRDTTLINAPRTNFETLAPATFHVSGLDSHYAYCLVVLFSRFSLVSPSSSPTHPLLRPSRRRENSLRRKSNWKCERKNETSDDDIFYSRNLRVKLRMHAISYPVYIYIYIFRKRKREREIESRDNTSQDTSSYPILWNDSVRKRDA